MRKKHILFSLLVLWTNVIFAQSGTLDTSFGVGGKRIDATFPAQGISDIVIQPDGKILGVGWSGSNIDSRFYAIRYNTDGSLDTSFGINGKYTYAYTTFTPSYGGSVELQPDGKIIIGGAFSQNGNESYDMAAIRLNTNGTLDTTFGVSGKTVIPISTITTNNRFSDIRDIAIQPDGKIVLVGNSEIETNDPNNLPFISYFTIARLNSDGTLDNSFSSDGKMHLDFSTSSPNTIINSGALAVKILNDSKILIGGFTDYSSQVVWVRLLTDGSLDTTFGSGGQQFSSTGGFKPISLCFLPDNSTLVGALGGTDGRIYKFTPNNTSDISFGTNNGYSSVQAGIHDMKIDSSGRIYASAGIYLGGTGYLTVYKFTSNGLLDSTFNGNGTVLTNFGPEYTDHSGTSLDIQNDGKILVAGDLRKPTSDFNFDVCFARYNNNESTLDTQDFVLKEKEFTIFPNPASNYIMISIKTLDNVSQIVKIYDELGRIVQQGYITRWNNKIDVSTLQQGLYFVSINNISKKLIIK